jgi:hypothetical protein
MIQVAVPGYSELLGPSADTYAEVMNGVDGKTSILYCLTLNGELYAPLEYGINQRRLMVRALAAFPDSSQQHIVAQFFRLRLQRNDPNVVEIFHRRYILALLLKEFNRRPEGQTEPLSKKESECRLLLAYLMVIEEENMRGRPHLDDALTKRELPFADYRLLWTPVIQQYQFNEWVSPLAELFKVFCLLRYAFDQWRNPLRTYLGRMGMEKIGQLVHSYYQIWNALQVHRPDSPWQKFAPIKPSSEARHLDHLCINPIIGKRELTLLDLKKKPLYLNPEFGYLVLDREFFTKHIFRGPYFDLHRTTDLKSMKYDTYSQMVSTNVLEKMYFRSIMRHLHKGSEPLFFDSEQQKGADGMPDCYLRIPLSLSVVESKAYIFPEELAEHPDFDVLRQYLDEKLIQKEDGTPKGVGQLVNAIARIHKGGYPFDPLPASHEHKQTIYPILIHNDFQFSLPGINTYLNDNFMSRLPEAIKQAHHVRPLTLINLDWLFDLTLRGGSFITLHKLIDRYHNLLDERKAALQKGAGTANEFLAAKASFDETYQSIFVTELPQLSEYQPSILDLLANAGLSQETLDAIV